MEKLAALIGELGHLAALPRADFHKAGVEHPATIGIFTALASQFAFLIASAEDADAPRAAAMALFSMLPNARTLTLEYLMGSAIDRKGIRGEVLKAQLAEVPPEMAEPLRATVTAYEEREERLEKEAIIAYEGYRLASAYLDAVYSRRGYPTHQAWIKDAEERVSTSAGKRILETIQSGQFQDGWIDKVPFSLEPLGAPHLPTQNEQAG